MKRTLVEQVMTAPVVTAGETMPYRDLVALLHASDISAVPVIAMAGQVLGVVSRYDLIAKAAGTAPASPPPGTCTKSPDRSHLAPASCTWMDNGPIVHVHANALLTGTGTGARHHEHRPDRPARPRSHPPVHAVGQPGISARSPVTIVVCSTSGRASPPRCPGNSSESGHREPCQFRKRIRGEPEFCHARLDKPGDFRPALSRQPILRQRAIVHLQNASRRTRSGKYADPAVKNG